MKAAFVVGGMEIAIAAPPGPLERIICDRYSWFLGRIVRPRSWLTISRLSQSRATGERPVLRPDDDGGVILDHPWFEGHLGANGRGHVGVIAQPSAIDAVLKTVVAAMAPTVGTIVMDGAAVNSLGHGYLLLGDDAEPLIRLANKDRRPVISPFCAAIRRRNDGWLLSGTPFGAAPGWPSRSADLAAVWLVERPARIPSEIEVFSGAEGAGVLIEHATIAARGLPHLEEAFDLCAQVGGQVPSGRLSVAETRSWDRIDELAAGISIRRALSTTQPELRGRLLRDALGAGDPT